MDDRLGYQLIQPALRGKLTLDPSVLQTFQVREADPRRHFQKLPMSVTAEDLPTDKSKTSRSLGHNHSAASRGSRHPSLRAGSPPGGTLRGTYGIHGVHSSGLMNCLHKLERTPEGGTPHT